MIVWLHPVAVTNQTIGTTSMPIRARDQSFLLRSSDAAQHLITLVWQVLNLGVV